MDNSLKRDLQNFIAERNWGYLRTPENLAKSIAIEAAELLEHYQWDPERADPAGVREELADIFIYAYELVWALDLDVEELMRAKLELNQQRYPVDRVKDQVVRKHDEL